MEETHEAPLVQQERRKLWLDCDPGRDDLVAILLALHLPELDLVGISSVFGNTSIDNTTVNCARILCSFGSPDQIHSIPIHQGASDPLIRSSELISHVHGVDGLGGVEGLLPASDPTVQEKLAAARAGNAVLGIAKALRTLAEDERMTIVATGSLTNIALLLKLFPALVKDKVQSVILMGGAEGRGNRTPVAESNIFSDPEAAHVVLNFDIKKVMLPLNVTHSALLLRLTHLKMLQPDIPFDGTEEELPEPATVLRRVLHTNMSFYAEAYRTRYGFDGPPCHDALTVAYLARPDLFEGKRHRVDVEIRGECTAGATVVDVYGYRHGELDDSWGATGKNVYMVERLDVEAWWDLFLSLVSHADKIVALHNTAPAARS